jgi:hypothetical protein
MFDQLSGLRTSFSIEKTIEPEPNRATVRVYNLNGDNRGTPKKGDMLTVRAGYAGNISGGEELPIIFRGTLTHITNKKDSVDWITEFRSGDGDDLKKSIMDEIFPPGTDPAAIIERLKNKIRELGVDLLSDFDGSILYWITEQFRRATNDATNPGASISDQVTGATKTLIGRVDDVLRTEMDRVGLSVSIQNNVLIVRPKGGSDGQEAVYLSPTTGLIGSPEVTEKGVSFKSLIIKGMDPGRLVQIDSRVVRGEYVLTRAAINGDTFGNDWYIDGECMVAGSKIELGGGTVEGE